MSKVMAARGRKRSTTKKSPGRGIKLASQRGIGKGKRIAKGTISGNAKRGYNQGYDSGWKSGLAKGFNDGFDSVYASGT